MTTTNTAARTYTSITGETLHLFRVEIRVGRRTVTWTRWATTEDTARSEALADAGSEYYGKHVAILSATPAN